MAKGAIAEKERLYVVNLRKGFKDAPLGRKGRAAIKYLRSYFEKTLKKEDLEIKLSPGVNREVLKHGTKKPLHKIKVKVSISASAATVMLPDEKEEKKRKIRKATPTDTKSKLQEMIAQKTAEKTDSKSPAKKEGKKPETKKQEEKKEKPKNGENDFEKNVRAD